MPHHSFARPEQLEMLSKALAEFGGHPAGQARTRGLGRKDHGAFRKRNLHARRDQKALNDRDATP